MNQLTVYHAKHYKGFVNKAEICKKETLKISTCVIFGCAGVGWR